MFLIVRSAISIVFLSESLTTRQTIGILLGAVAVYLVSVEQRNWRQVGQAYGTRPDRSRCGLGFLLEVDLGVLCVEFLQTHGERHRLAAISGEIDLLSIVDDFLVRGDSE